MFAYMCYIVHEIWCMTDVITIFHFGLFFAPLPHLLTAPKNQNFNKMKKNAWKYHHLAQVYHKS